MRSASLTQLHARAITVLEIIAKAEGRMRYYPSAIREARARWQDERRAAQIEMKRAATEAAIQRLTLYYARLVERINQVLTKSLHAA